MYKRQAYATLENEGVYRQPTCITMITDMDGNIVVMPEQEEKQVYQSSAAHEMTNILEGVLTVSYTHLQNLQFLQPQNITNIIP